MHLPVISLPRAVPTQSMRPPQVNIPQTKAERDQASAANEEIVAAMKMLNDYEDIAVGLEYETPGITIGEHHVLGFAGLTGDFYELHVDDDYARSIGFPGRVAHGLLGLALADGLKNRASVRLAAIVFVRDLHRVAVDAPRLVHALEVRAVGLVCRRVPRGEAAGDRGRHADPVGLGRLRGRGRDTGQHEHAEHGENDASSHVSSPL